MFKPEGASVRKDVAPAQAGGGAGNHADTCVWPPEGSWAPAGRGRGRDE